MQVISCQNGKKHLDNYADLIRDLYQEYPFFVENKIQRDAQAFSRTNPFFRHGTVKNIFVLEGDKPLAHGSAIIDHRLPDHVGLIGFFECVNNARYAREIFNNLTEYLSGYHRYCIRGPVQLTTWQGFGFSCTSHNQPYFMEPFSQDYYCDFFEDYGFKVTQQNITVILGIDETHFGGFSKEKRKLLQDGFKFEIAENECIYSILDEVYHLSTEIFFNTFSFVKISLEEFRTYFESYTKQAPECFLCLIRSPTDEAIGFLWGMPDLYSPNEKRLILKTIGVLNRHREHGIGKALFYTAYCYARDNHFKKFILSTMRSDNMPVRYLTSGTNTSYYEYKVYEI